MKEKNDVEQAFAEARKELSKGDYFKSCATLTSLIRKIPGASVQDGDVIYMLGWLSR